jgi:hypothetical protein
LTPLVDARAVSDWGCYDNDTGDYRGVIALGALEPGVTFVWEPEGGFESSRLSTLAAMSAHGSACSHYWNDVNCTPTFGYAVQGRLRRYFTTDDPAMSYGAGVDVPLPEEAELPWPPPWTEEDDDQDAPEVDGRESALLLQARLMDVSPPDPSWLERDGIRWFGTPFHRDAEPRPDEG